MGVWSQAATALGRKFISNHQNSFIRAKPRKQKQLLLSYSLHIPHSLSCATRRTFGLSFLFCICSPSLPTLLLAHQIDDHFILDRYTDTKEGFSLLVPSSWVKIDKAGATVLFEDAGSKGNNVGVVVSPVRLTSLEDFGTPQFVADKLIQAEKRKESTKDADVIAVAERVGDGGLPVYEFEYRVDSTRGGMKRIFSAAFVASKKLYLLNISYSDRPENPIDTQTRMVLEQVLHSFDKVSSSPTS